MPVITISSQYGAGGPELGRSLAKRLDIDYLDKTLRICAIRRLQKADQLIVYIYHTILR